MIGTFFKCHLLQSLLDESCNKFDNMLICRDMNLPKISWYSSESSTSTCEQRFVDILNDHFLLQVNRPVALRGHVTNAPFKR